MSLAPVGSREDFATLLIHDVLIINPAPTTPDRYHDVVEDWTGAAEFVERAWIRQAYTAERTIGRDGVETTHKIALAHCSKVTARSRVRWMDRDLTFEVVGDPAPRFDESHLHHVDADIRVVAG